MSNVSAVGALAGLQLWAAFANAASPPADAPARPHLGSPVKIACPVLTRSRDENKNDGALPEVKALWSDDAAVEVNGRNTAWYDHYFLKPACSRPFVLKVADGDYFQVVIKNTDTTQFAYTITAVPDQEIPTSTSGATGAGIPVERWGEFPLTMRHSKVFSRYRVVIALRADLAPGGTRATGDRSGGPLGGEPAIETAPPPERPVLHPVAFDVWVATRAKFELAFMGGAAFSGLRSPHYFIATDNKNTADAADDVKTVKEDTGARDDFRPDVIAVTNLRFPERWKGVGVAFGVGLNNDSDPRYFFGPSLFLGRHLLFHAGWAGGRVDRLPDGQKIDDPPINGDTTLSNLPKRFAHSFYASVSFGFIPGSEDAFKGAFGATQKPAKPATETPPANGAAAEDASKFAGTYQAKDLATAADKVKAKAEIAGSKPEEQQLIVTFSDSKGKETGKRTLKRVPKEPKTFAEDKFSCMFSTIDKKPALKCQEANQAVFDGVEAETE